MEPNKISSFLGSDQVNQMNLDQLLRLIQSTSGMQMDIPSMPWQIVQPGQSGYSSIGDLFKAMAGNISNVIQGKQATTPMPWIPGYQQPAQFKETQ